jgi:hypothetical protein
MVANLLSHGLLLVELFAALALGSSTPIYKDASAPVEKRVKDLLGRMTIEDKMSQLIQGVLPIHARYIFRNLPLFPLRREFPLADIVINRRYHELDELHLG